jgi:hypothetical protein
MQAEGKVAPSGELFLKVIRNPYRPSPWPSKELSFAEVAKYGMPQRGLASEVNAWRRRNWTNLPRALRKIMVARALGIPHVYGQLFLTVFRGDGTIEELGLASLRIITTAGVRYICDDFNAGANDVANMKFHGFGTGATAEVVGNTILQTEETTQYAVDNTRPTGSQASATLGNNATYTTVATYSPDSGGTRAITEWGLFSQAATGAASAANTLFDRVTFAVVNIVAAQDSLQSTFVLTMVSGS